MISRAAGENLMSDALSGLDSRIDNNDGYTVQDLIDRNQWYGWGDRQTDKDTGHNGKPSMKVSAAAIGANAHDYAFLKLAAGQYVCSVWVKTDAYQSATTSLDVDIYALSVLNQSAQLNNLANNNPPLRTVENKFFYDQAGKNEFSTADWTQVQTAFTLDEEAVVRIHFGSVYSWGAIWASDIAVTAVQEEESESSETSSPENDWVLDPDNLLSGEQVYVANRKMNVVLSDETVARIIEEGIWYGWGEQLFDEEIGHNGKPSMKGSAAQIGANSFDYTFVRLPAGSYELSAWVKTDGFQAAALGLYLDIYGTDVLGDKAKLEDFTAEPKKSLQNNIFYGMNSRDEFSTADWTLHTFRFALDEESVVRLCVRIAHFQGNIWVSDFSLKPFAGDIDSDKYEDGNLLTKKVVNNEQWVDNSPGMQTVDFLMDNDFWYGWGTHGSIDEETGHNGKPSQKVSAPILGGNMCRYTFVKLEPGNYRFTAWVKTEEFCGNALHLGARIFDNDIGEKSASIDTLGDEPATTVLNRYINATHVDNIYSTEDWTEVNVDFTVTGNTPKYVRLSVEAGHFEGTAWISDFRLAPHEIESESSEEDSYAPSGDTSSETSGETSAPDTSIPDAVDTGVSTLIPTALALTAVSTGAVLTLRRKAR